jgi:enediyne biosynthesis protein E4
LLLVNGHVFPEVDRLGIDIHYRDHAILYRNLGGSKFADISENSGPGIRERHAARGAAFGDYDNDGLIEVVINNQNEAPSLLKQALRPANHWIILKLAGTRSNRSALGAKVKLTSGGRTQFDEVRSGSSYLSQNDLRIHFGLGSSSKAERIEIEWPSGTQQTLRDVAGDRVVSIEEPRQ